MRLVGFWREGIEKVKFNDIKVGDYLALFFEGSKDSVVITCGICKGKSDELELLDINIQRNFLINHKNNLSECKVSNKFIYWSNTTIDESALFAWRCREDSDFNEIKNSLKKITREITKLRKY